MLKKYEESNKAFVNLNNEEIDYLLKNVRHFSWWTGCYLNSVSNHGYGEWWEVYADGGGAIGILKGEDIRDRFTRCGYELDTRDIKYIK